MYFFSSHNAGHDSCAPTSTRDSDSGLTHHDSKTFFANEAKSKVPSVALRKKQLLVHLVLLIPSMGFMLLTIWLGSSPLASSSIYSGGKENCLEKHYSYCTCNSSLLYHSAVKIRVDILVEELEDI